MSLTINDVIIKMDDNVDITTNHIQQRIDQVVVNSDDKFYSKSVIDNMFKQWMLKIYPVGSIYTSTTSTNPATLFGGGWERITGRFLLACNDSGTYIAGNTGGEVDVTLTVDQIPSHSHDAPQGSSKADDYVFEVSRTNSLATTGRNQITTSSNSGRYVNAANINAADSIGMDDVNAADSTKSTKTTGGSKAHNNMPPYLAVYVWKRVS